MRAAHTAHSQLKDQHGQVPLQAVAEEDPDTLDQLPTPREIPQHEARPLQPIVSDTLFSPTDLESIEGSSGHTQTAASVNPLFTIVDRTGVFDMEVVFCLCPHSGNNDAQLLQSALFPATFEQIETLFTVSVLDDFLIDNLECKTTAQQYYSKLQLMTNKMFPNKVPVCANHFQTCSTNSGSIELV